MKKMMSVLTILTFFLMLMQPFTSTIQGSMNKNVLWKNQIEDENNEMTYYALIVGCSRYQNSLNNIPKINPFPDSSMKYVYNRLLNASNWEEENIFLLLNEDATKENIKNRFQFLSNKVTEQDVFVFSWMGHGTYISDEDQDELDGYDEAICPYDTAWGENGVENLLIDDELDELFSEVTAKAQFIMFESCFSGGLVEDENQRNQSSYGYLDCDADNRVVVMSTLPGKIGFGIQGVGWPMSYLFAEAFSEIKNDVNGDGWISAEEAFLQVLLNYPGLEDQFFSTLTYFSLNLSIVITSARIFMKINHFFQKHGVNPIPSMLCSLFFSVLAYNVYHHEFFYDLNYEISREFIDTYFSARGVENYPNMVDGFDEELPLIQIA